MADHDSLCGRQLGEFVLRARIDEGGFGIVYRCDQPMLNRQAVVKVLHMRRQSHGAALQRFSREARLASMLDHPYAAHIYGAGVEGDGLVWIAMEMVQGITLRDWLRARGTLSLEEFVPLFACIAEVVEFAHQRGIVHRDLKPSNIMVVEHAGQRWPKLLDFGIAKLLGEAEQLDALDGALSEQSGEPDPDTTRAMRKGALPRQPGPRRLTGKRVIGTPQYMAPEQWTEPAAVGPAADLYALGIIAYEVLTGRPPFDVASTSTDRTEELAEMHCSAPVPPIGVGSTPGLEHFFQRALAKRPEDRFATARELAAALEAEKDSRMLARVRSAATHWHDKGRMTGLLWRDDALAALEQWTQHSASAGTLSSLELEFVEACKEQETARVEQMQRRMVWRRRLGWGAAVAAVAGVFVGFQVRAAYRADTAEQIAAATAIQAEIDEGRSALLHDDLVEAQQHLAEALRRGDHSPTTAFMLARAMQPLRAEVARFAASSGRMWSAAWSPDGRRIVTTDDTAAQIWDVAARQLVVTLPHGDTVYHALFSADGARIVTAGGDGAVRIWRAADGAPVRELTRPHHDGKPARYYLVAMTADARLVAATDTAGKIVDVWDAVSGASLAELGGDGLGWPALAFSANGRWLAVGGGDDVRVFDAKTWARVTTLPGPRIRTLAWDPAGSQLLTGSTGGDASIWALPGGGRARHLREVGEPVDAVAWSPDGRLVAAATRSGALQVFEAATGALQSLGGALHGKAVAIEFDRSSRSIAAAGAGAVAISDAASGLPVTLLEGPAGVVLAAHFDPSSEHVLGASADGTTRIWSAASPYRRWSSAPVGDDCSVATSLEPDRRYVAVACLGRVTRVWDTARDRLLAELPAPTVPGGDFTTALPAVSAAGDLAAVARGRTIELYELPGGRLVRTIAHEAPISAVAFGGGRDLASGDTSGIVLLTQTGAEPAPQPAATGGIDALAVLGDGRIVVTDARRHLRVIARGAVLADLQASTRIGLLRPSPDGRQIVAVPIATAAQPPALWDLDGHGLARRLEGHVGRVFTARWVAGDRILTTGGDGAIRMWDSTGALVQVYRGGTGYVADAILSPDGDLVIGGGASGQLRFWEAATGRALWTTLAHKSALIGVHVDGEDIVTRGFDGDLARWRISRN